MPVNLENSAAATGLEKVGFHSTPKQRQCQRMFQLLHNCAYLTCWQSNGQNSHCEAFTVCKLRTSISAREAWRAAIHGVANSRTRLSD